MSEPIRLLVVGATGRMGNEILDLATADSRFETSVGFSQSRSEKVILSATSLQAVPPEKVDVAIDFSQPAIFGDVLAWCARHKKPLVSGVTGLTEADQKRLSAAAQDCPVLWAPNMSLGVAVVAEMFQALSRLEGYDFQVEEVHHNRKKDKPSGTALFLQQRLEAALGRNLPEPLALRGGGVFGIHKVWAIGEEEIVTIEHSAMNRKVFARGALQAAAWIRNQKPGLYAMRDVLGV